MPSHKKIRHWGWIIILTDQFLEVSLQLENSQKPSMLIHSKAFHLEILFVVIRKQKETD